MNVTFARLHAVMTVLLSVIVSLWHSDDVPVHLTLLCFVTVACNLCEAGAMQSHNGGNHDLALQDNGYMNFLVDASRERLLGVREDLLRIPAVTSATFHTHNINNSDW
jgi:hypothetical protein